MRYEVPLIFRCGRILLLILRSVVLYPSPDRRVIYKQAALEHHLFEVPVAERVIERVMAVNGLITSDKFCMSRSARLSLSWRRNP
jgi:hypothetical protein